MHCHQSQCHPYLIKGRDLKDKNESSKFLKDFLGKSSNMVFKYEISERLLIKISDSMIKQSEIPFFHSFHGPILVMNEDRVQFSWSIPYLCFWDEILFSQIGYCCRKVFWIFYSDYDWWFSLCFVYKFIYVVIMLWFSCVFQYEDLLLLLWLKIFGGWKLLACCYGELLLTALVKVAIVWWTLAKGETKQQFTTSTQAENL